MFVIGLCESFFFNSSVVISWHCWAWVNWTSSSTCWIAFHHRQAVRRGIAPGQKWKKTFEARDLDLGLCLFFRGRTFGEFWGVEWYTCQKWLYAICNITCIVYETIPNSCVEQYYNCRWVVYREGNVKYTKIGTRMYYALTIHWPINLLTPSPVAKPLSLLGISVICSYLLYALIPL